MPRALLLNLVLPGAGFSLLGQPWWHLGWFGLMCAANVVTAVLLLRLNTFWPLLLSLGTHAALLWHGARVAPRTLDPSVRAALIALHAVFAVMVACILALALVPGLGDRLFAPRT